MAFGLNFFTLAPGLRVAGDSLAYAYKFTKRGGQASGTNGLEVGLTDDPTIKLLEEAVSGYETVTDRDAIYTTLVSGGLTEIFPGFALGIDSLSSIEITDSAIKFALAGAQPLLQLRSNNVPVITKVGDAGFTWDLPPATFATLKATAETYQSDLKTKVDAMIASRIAADDTLTAAVAAETARVDALIASGMWLYPDQAAFPAAADNHGRIVHSHADGSMFYAHAGAWHKIENEAEAEAARLVIQNDVDANETALSGRLDTLEADPTTAAALAAGDAATLSSANTYTDTAVSNVIGSAPGVLDTLGEIANAINDDANAYTTLVAQIAAVQTDVDNNETASDAAEATLQTNINTVQADVDANEAASDAAESALSGRLDALEADPTTASAVAAVQSDVDQNETDADAADAALSGRLDVLEADPTTATAVAAVQADVNQNESDADAAIAGEATTRGNADTALSNRLDTLEADPTTATALALKAPLADPDFTGQLEVDTNARLEFDSNLTKVHNVLRGTSIEIGNNIALKPAAADGRVEVEGEFYLRPSDMTDAADDAAAAAAGVIVGQVYRNGSQLMIRVS
ncbi:MAG: hypothetical protein L7S55_04190 [Luminiphilus sp.]|nr:hypothetical protein [Luminiphilus sp.]